MPNRKNISAPIVLISAGRSGTTLFSDIFDRHPDCSSNGETVDLIFDLWNAGQRSISHIGANLLKRASASVDGEIARFVREGFLALMEDDKPHWFQKPIGIPFAFSHALFETELWDEKADLYWSTMRNVFPQAKYFTVLRHPCDIVMSYRNRFGLDERQSWAVLGFVAHILLHPDSQVRHAVPYDALLLEREATLRALLSYLEIDFHPAVLDAFDTVHTLNVSTGSSCESDFTWESQWSDLDPSCAQPQHLEAIAKLYRKFGHELAMPRAFAERIGADVPTDVDELVKPDTANVSQMREYIRQLENRERCLGQLWEERAIRQDNELYQAYLKLENTQRDAYLKLEDARRDAYLKQEDAHRRAYQSMQAQIDELVAARDWLAGHAASWRAAARAAEKRLNDPVVRIVLWVKKGRWAKLGWLHLPLRARK